MNWRLCAVMLYGMLVWTADPSAPLPMLPAAAPGDVGMDRAMLLKARDYALTGGGSGIILRHGRKVLEWGDPARRYDLKSTTKSFGATCLGVALLDGRIKLGDKATAHHPSFGIPPEANRGKGWLEKITIFHLATQTAGFDKPGGYKRLLFEPGTRWAYSDGGPNWLAECLTLIYRQDLHTLMFQRVFTPLGIGKKDLTWRKNSYRPAEIDGIPRREFGSGIHANVNAMARVGLLYLKRGVWQGRRILPEGFIDAARKTPKAVAGLPVMHESDYGRASDHYGLLWWNNNDGTLPDVPRDAYWSWGLYESLIVVIPSLDVVVARAGKSWKRKWAGHYRVLAPFLNPIAAACRKAPYPDSPVINGIRWAPLSTIVQKAEGSDNWPITWGDDDLLYTAFGDGWGFEPKTKQKLSLGFARVMGMPPDFQGQNIRTSTGERSGDGPKGAKASGLLMVKGVLYMLARNTGNAQVAFSRDRGRTWSWCSWRFTEGFGCPTFLNAGRDYADAPDGFVYVYSMDSESAYEPADRMVLARVPADRIIQRRAYEFFGGFDDYSKPAWTSDIQARKGVFSHPGRCYRSSVTYLPRRRRFLWCQVLPESKDKRGPRFEGGFGIYDAPHPWGPWTTVFFTNLWDTGPGENCSLPGKWMDADARTGHLVFSGNDCFSIRRVSLHWR